MHGGLGGLGCSPRLRVFTIDTYCSSVLLLPLCCRVGEYTVMQNYNAVWRFKPWLTIPESKTATTFSSFAIGAFDGITPQGDGTLNWCSEVATIFIHISNFVMFISTCVMTLHSFWRRAHAQAKDCHKCAIHV